MTRCLIPVLLALLVAPAALGQYEGAAPSRRQKQELVPLVRATCLRLELHLPSFTADELETRVERALFNQVSHVVDRRWKELVIELLVADLGLSSADSKAVQYGPYEEFGRQVPSWPSGLLEFDEVAWGGRDKGAYQVRGVTRDHKALIMGRGAADVKYRLAAWTGREPSKDQARGLKELADHWAGRLEAAFGIEREDRRFRELLESVFVTLDTERAVLGTLTKLRALVRPVVREVLQTDDVGSVLDAERTVSERIEEVLGAAEWWPRLQADHRAMVADAKAQRRALKERVRAEKRRVAEDDG